MGQLLEETTPEPTSATIISPRMRKIANISREVSNRLGVVEVTASPFPTLKACSGWEFVAVLDDGRCSSHVGIRQIDDTPEDELVALIYTELKPAVSE